MQTIDGYKDTKTVADHLLKMYKVVKSIYISDKVQLDLRYTKECWGNRTSFLWDYKKRKLRYDTEHCLICIHKFLKNTVQFKQNKGHLKYIENQLFREKNIKFTWNLVIYSQVDHWMATI